jgi:hypothetical protein
VGKRLKSMNIAEELGCKGIGQSISSILQHTRKDLSTQQRNRHLSSMKTLSKDNNIQD